MLTAPERQVRAEKAHNGAYGQLCNVNALFDDRAWPTLANALFYWLIRALPASHRLFRHHCKNECQPTGDGLAGEGCSVTSGFAEFDTQNCSRRFSGRKLLRVSCETDCKMRNLRQCVLSALLPHDVEQPYTKHQSPLKRPLMLCTLQRTASSDCRPR